MNPESTLLVTAVTPNRIFSSLSGGKQNWRDGQHILAQSGDVNCHKAHIHRCEILVLFKTKLQVTIDNWQLFFKSY